MLSGLHSIHKLFHQKEQMYLENKVKGKRNSKQLLLLQHRLANAGLGKDIASYNKSVDFANLYSTKMENIQAESANTV